MEKTTSPETIFILSLTGNNSQLQAAGYSFKNKVLVFELNLEESLPAKSLSTYYAPFNAASYVIRIAMPHSTYASYVGLVRKKERREFALPQEDPFSFSLYYVI